MSRARELSKLGNLNVLAADDVNNEVGIASTVPRSTLDVRGELQVGTGIQVGPAGVITATSFSGGTSGNVTGAACTFTTGTFNGNVTIGGTLTYEDVTNVDALGIVTARAGVNVSGGQIQVGVAYSVGAAGVCTAAGFVGPLTGAVTGNATGLTGTPNISAGTIAGSTGTFTGDVDIADKIVHTGDTNTAIRFPSADTITAETGGSERVRITSGGELLVGTTSGDSTYQTHIKHETYGLLKLETSLTGADGAYLDFYHNSTSPADEDQLGSIGFKGKNSADEETTFARIQSRSSDVTDGTEDGYLTFHTRAGGTFAERLRITSTGLVGINTDSPGTNHNLEILGNASAYAILNVKTQSLGHGSSLELGAVDDDDYGNITQFASAAGGNYSGRMRFIAGGTETFNLVGGNAGVGEASPDVRLHVTETINTAYTVDTATQDANNLLKLENASTTAEAFAGMQLRTGNGADMYVGVIQQSGNAGDLYVTNQNSPNKEIVRLKSSGLVGIASTNPQTTLHIQEASEPTVSLWTGGTKRSAFQAQSNGTYIYSYQDNPLIFSSATGTAFSEKLRIGAEGLFSFNNGELVERVNITAGKLSDNTNINLSSGMVHYFTTQESTTSTPNIRSSASATLNSLMDAGDMVTVTLITTAAAGGYSANVTIDGNAVTEEWVGGEAPSEGGDNGLDIYVYTIICTHATNTGDSGFKVIANKVNAT